jgi:hypothetical protein
MMARQNAAKKRSIDGYVSILSRVLTQQARLQWIYRSARNALAFKRDVLKRAPNVKR